MNSGLEAQKWWRNAQAIAREEAVDPRFLQALRAFPPPAEGPVDVGAALARAVDEEQLPGVLQTVVSEGVDAAQAAMFRRRFEAVRAWLRELAAQHAAARVLLLGLSGRLREILAYPTDRPLRVRALVDFYYSQAGLLAHGVGPHLPTAEQLVGQAKWRALCPGVQTAQVEGVSQCGPLFANVLKASAGAVKLAVRAWPDEQARQVSLQQRANEAGAIAAISGGFFLFSEADIERLKQANGRRWRGGGLEQHGGCVGRGTGTACPAREDRGVVAGCALTTFHNDVSGNEV